MATYNPNDKHKMMAEALSGLPAGAQPPISAITGQPAPTFEEKAAPGKAIGSYLYSNLMGKTQYDEPYSLTKTYPPEYFETPSIFAPRVQDPSMGEVDPLGGKAARVAKKVAGKVGDTKTVLGLPVQPGAGDLGVATQIRERVPLTKQIKWGGNLSPEAQAYIKRVKGRQNTSAVHYNGKTGMSIDFSTSCPKRQCGIGACPYCYVEEARTAKKHGMGFMHGKPEVDNKYVDEIMGMPADLVTEVNRDGGLRMFSFGDFRPGIDDENVAKVLEHAKQKGLYIKAITKERDLIDKFGDHPNFRANISVDYLPREMSNSPTVDEALKWKAGRDNLKVRSVALNEEQALDMARDPRIDVVTPYHGLTGEKLLTLIKKQNPELVKRVGEDALKAELMTWQDMKPKSKAFKRIVTEAPSKVCCQSGNCAGDKTKCGFSTAGQTLSVLTPLLMPAAIGGTMAASNGGGGGE